MQLATYKSIRPGVQGLANIIIMLRLLSRYSHSEVVFHPGDGVDHLMPDRSCEPDADGALWAASTVAWERMPAWSPRRAGKHGGTRFKRIVFKPENWVLQPYRRDPVRAAEVFKLREGMPYSWRLIIRWASWLLGLLWRPSKDHTVCSQIAAEAGGWDEPERADPATLHVATEAENRAHALGVMR